MNYLKVLGLCNNYTEKELDSNYYQRINLILPHLDESPRLMRIFSNVETSYELLKGRNGLMSLSNEELKINQSKIIKNDLMFNKLNDSFNETINVIYVNNGEVLNASGCLESITKYDNIKLTTGEMISFLNYDEAIMKILSENGDVLYFNPFITKSYHIDDDEMLGGVYQKCYGETIGLSYFEINKINHSLGNNRIRR